MQGSAIFPVNTKARNKLEPPGNELEPAEATGNKLKPSWNKLKQPVTNRNYLKRDEIDKKTDIRNKKFVSGFCACAISLPNVVLIRNYAYLNLTNFLFWKVLSFDSYNFCTV